jgi:hypothetical protein
VDGTGSWSCSITGFGIRDSNFLAGPRRQTIVLSPHNKMPLTSPMTFHFHLLFYHTFSLYPNLFGHKLFRFLMLFNQMLSCFTRSKLPLRVCHADLPTSIHQRCDPLLSKPPNYFFAEYIFRSKFCDDGILIQLLCFWTLSIWTFLFGFRVIVPQWWKLRLDDI